MHKPSLWEEIREVIAAVDAEQYRIKVSNEKRKKGSLLYSPVCLNKAFSKLLTSKGWREKRVYYWVTEDDQLIRKTLMLPPEQQKKIILSSGKTPIRSYKQTDYVKDRVAIEVQFGKYAFVAYDLFVKHLAFYIEDQIDVGIEILPMKNLQTQMSSGIGYFEGELYNVLRHGRGVPAVPLVLVGVDA